MKEVASHTIIVTNERTGQESVIACQPSANLRDVLLGSDLSPYTSLTGQANCGGRGLCAMCGVHIKQRKKPNHWHDWLAERFRDPRLSCQIAVAEDMEVVIPKKLIWGKRRPRH